MPTPGPIELIIILIIAIVFIGPGRLPDVGAALGKSIREFRKASTDVAEAARIDTAPAAPAATGANAANPAPSAAPAPTPEPSVPTPTASTIPAPIPAPSDPTADDDAPRSPSV